MSSDDTAQSVKKLEGESLKLYGIIGKLVEKPLIIINSALLLAL